MGGVIRPFRIDVPQSDLDDLHHRLDRALWPDELPDAGWEYGVPAGYLGELAHRWRSTYDWRAHEERLNELPQFVTEIDGQTVHFAHARSADPGALPLLLTHGWPSTFADFAGVVEPLTTGGPAFHVVVPSVPGFGFSGPTRERGWDVRRIARAWAELMHRLGYERYVVQGGDFGALISPEVARVAPEHVIGVHVNALVTAVDPTSPDPTAGLGPDDVARLRAGAARWAERSGYATIQSTRPQTLAYALTDSPLGLLAWNLEWFVDYDPTRTAQAPVDPDAVLTDVSIFWFTRTSGSAARLYKESRAAFYGGERVDVPTAVAVFPGDGALRALAERSLLVVRWTEYGRGGHFASLQAPDLLVADVRAFVRGISSGRS
ncbi:epoxide hydrolase [Pseudonocardia adelaidensis]|uniref:Epoxide hydrolase n=1 Tax=Pseudonocardia adelaidensis TaxID=648754 RepID=A0ABP9NPH8_9PSEU